MIEQHFTPLLEHMAELSGIDLTPATVALVLVVLDVVVGIAQAALNNDFQSSKMRDGMKHKAGEALFVSLGYILEVVLALIDFETAGIGVSTTVPLGLGASAYIIVMELSSLLEHVIALNPELAGTGIFRIFRTPGGTQKEGE